MFSIMSDSEEQDINSSDDDEDLMNLLFLIMYPTPSCLLIMRKGKGGKGAFTSD